MEKCQVLLVYLYRIVDILIIVITLQNINEGIAIKPSSCYTLLGKITIKSTLYFTYIPQLLTYKMANSVRPVSQTFAEFLLENANNGSEILAVLDDIVEVEDTVL